MQTHTCTHTRAGHFFQWRALQSQAFTEKPKVQVDAPAHQQFHHTPVSLSLWLSVHPLWLVPDNQLHLELLKQKKSYSTSWEIHTLSRPTAVWAGSRLKDGLGELYGKRVEPLWALPVHCYYCYPPEKVLQKSGKGCHPAGYGPFESIPNHHCCQDEGLDVTVPSANLLPCKGTKIILFCCFLPVICWSTKLGCSTSHCNLMRVLPNHRNMPKSNNSNNRNNNKHSFVCSRVRDPQMP